MKWFIFFSILFLGYGNSSAQRYDYPVKPGTEAWKALKTHADMIRVCQIPDAVLKQITTADLLETCLKYPLLFDMYAYNNPQVGFDAMSKKHNGFLTLKNREDAGTVVLEKYKKINAQTVDTLKTEVEKGRFTTLLSAIEILIANDDILIKLTHAQKKELLKEILKKHEGKELNKDVYGTLGILTLSYTASKIFVALEDSEWNSYVQGNKGAKLFSDTMSLTDKNIIQSIIENIHRILK